MDKIIDNLSAEGALAGAGVGLYLAALIIGIFVVVIKICFLYYGYKYFKKGIELQNLQIANEKQKYFLNGGPDANR